MDEAEKVRVLVCGDDGVGKNKLIKKFISVGEKRTSTLSTIGVDVQHKTIRVGGKDVKLQIWTTAGQERFRSMPAKYYGRADGVVLVYDVTQRKTFDNVQQWLTDIAENTLNSDVKIALVGNKIDLLAVPKTADTHSSSRALASSSGILFFETSAETGENVEELFMALATEILDKRKTRQNSQSASAEKEPSSPPPPAVENITVDCTNNSRTQSPFSRLCRNRC